MSAPKRGTIRVPITTGLSHGPRSEAFTEVDIEAFFFGLVAVHKGYAETSAGWTITHIKTGRRIDKYRLRRADSFRLAAILNRQPIWKFTRDPVGKRGSAAFIQRLGAARRRALKRAGLKVENNT